MKMLNLLHLAFLVFLQLFGTRTLGKKYNTIENQKGSYRVNLDLGKYYEKKGKTAMPEEEYISHYEDSVKKASRNKRPAEFLDLSGFKEGCGTLSSHSQGGEIREGEISGGGITPAHSFPWIVRLHG